MDKFGKICQHHWKERLKSNKIAKFDSDLLKNSEEIAPLIHEISQTFVWGGGGLKTCPPTYKQRKIFVTLRSYFLAHLKCITFKFSKFNNFNALFSVVLTDFSELVHIKSWKNCEKVYSEAFCQTDSKWYPLIF